MFLCSMICVILIYICILILNLTHVLSDTTSLYLCHTYTHTYAQLYPPISSGTSICHLPHGLRLDLFLMEPDMQRRIRGPFACVPSRFLFPGDCRFDEGEAAFRGGRESEEGL